MARRIAFDTNILAYAAGVRRVDADVAKAALVQRFLRVRAAEGDDRVVSAQVLAELHNLLVRRSTFTRQLASDWVGAFAADATIVPTSGELLADAFELSVRHDVPTFDAIILAAAVAGECDTLYSEDFQHRFAWRGVEVVNPLI